MTKLLTIDVNCENSQNNINYIVNVIANKQENIVILKDVLDDHLNGQQFHCTGIHLSHCFQHCYELLPPLCSKGMIYVQSNEDTDIDSAIDVISKIILRHIL